MRRASPVIFFLSFACLAGLLLFGCEEAAVFRRPRLVRGGDGRLYALAETVRVGTSGETFSLLVCPDPARKNWRAPSELRGRPIALLPAAGGTALVFGDGVVTRIRDHEGVLEKTVQYVKAQPLVDAVRDESGILGLEQDGDRFQVYRLGESAWEPFGPPCRVMERAVRVRLGLSAGRPVLLWIRSPGVGEELDPGASLGGRILDGGVWQPVPDVPEACRIRDMVTLMDGPALEVYGVDRREDTALPLHALSRWRLEDGAWTRRRSLDLSWAAGTLSGYEVTLARDGEVLTGLLAAGGQMTVFPVRDGKAGEGHLLAGEAGTASAQDELLFFFLLSLVFLAFGVGRILRQRRNRRRGEASPEGPAEPVYLQTAEGLLPIDTSAGGLASPMERALALALDYGIVIPAPLFYLRALKVDFERIAQDMTVGIAPPASVLSTFQESFLVFLAVYIAYTCLFEVLTGATLGKRALGLAVRGIEGGRPAAFRVVLRNVLRPIDHWTLPIAGMPILFFPALVSMIFSRFNQRVGDRIGGTMVVRRIPIQDRELILASSSPRRQVILKEMGLDFTIVPPEVDESMPLAANPESAVEQVARRKAEAVGNRLSGGEIVLASDTIVVRDSEILGKPRDRDHARKMLASLSGRSHYVVTAVAIWDRMTGRHLSACERTEIRMRSLTEEEIDAYVESGEPDDKAGAYAIQGGAGAFIERVEGSSSNVVGLPAELTHALLESLET